MLIETFLEDHGKNFNLFELLIVQNIKCYLNNKYINMYLTIFYDILLEDYKRI